MSFYLPCKRCGNSLPMVRGSIVQCFYCDTRNLYMESVLSHKNYLAEILNITTIKNEGKTKFEDIERRKALIESSFRELNLDFREYRHLIITKLDNIDVSPVKLFKLIRTAGNLEIIIENYLLIHLKEEDDRKKFQEIRDLLYIINKSLLGLYFSFLAKKSIRLKECSKFYQYAERSFENIVNYCKITQFEDQKFNLGKEEQLYSILAKFATILRKILTKNPRNFSDKFKHLLKELDKIEKKDIRILNLYSQIEQIYQLEKDTCFILEKVKVIDPFTSIEPFKENLIFNTEKNLDKLNNFKDLIYDISKKYQKYQRNLLKLHSGQLVDYLESYRAEFINNKNKNIEKFNDLLDEMISKAFEDYNLETIELLDTLSDFIQIDLYNGNLIQRFEIEREDLINLDELLKNFINNLFKKPLLRNLEPDYYKKLVSIISGKHTEFDKFISKYINRLLKEFEDFRNNNTLSIEEQRNQFSLKLKPNLQKLVDMSFTLNEDYVPYPLFIDLDFQNKNFRVNNPDIITIIIENSNLTDIRDIKIYFFLPNSFQSKLKFLSLKKLKANERRKLKVKITPKKKGTFPFMVMIEYQHTNKTFWMPSMKLKLEVEEPIKIENPHLLAKEFSHDFLEINKTEQLLRFTRSLF
ncbi:MAG: hypothetical protein ACFFA6_01020 [Promethearchaeota archaeon]